MPADRRRANQTLDAPAGASPDPIAIIGMACRFAGGANTPERFWTLLKEGRTTAGEIPEERWEWYASQGHEYAAAVRGATARGSFLDDVKGFDADFFDITPREAALMDPQQRIVLELAWEALEHAGIPPTGLAGSDAGVFMGVGADDYGRRLLEDLPRVEAWSGIGGAYCAVSNRVSYVLDLRGPSMSVDTACSSSLVAIHLAAQALRSGECPVALAGGVLVVAAPGLSLVLDAAGATSPDGRSKSFSSDADGYGRGEGAGVLVLKRLRDAERDGDRVLAVIRGSAVHQDGRTNGIMAPNGVAQAHLMRRAYAAAGIDPASVGYVEAHGTGTRAGDPLEAEAMSSVFGTGRPAGRPVLIGSVKPNIGHLEAAAGVAGVIKAVLALRHGEIPPSVNFAGPSPAIPWDTNGLRVVTEPTPWPEDGGPRRAGVSGYGYGGTIAHVILEQADAPAAPSGHARTEAPEQAHHPEQPEEAGAPAASSGDTRSEQPDGTEQAGRTRLYPLSAMSEAGVGRYAARLAEHLSRDTTAVPADVGHTLAHRRAHLPYRAAVLAADLGQLTARLRELAGTAGLGAVTGGVLPSAGEGLVWVFSGHGSQWTGMARELLGDPVFAAVIDEIEPVFAEEMGVSPRAVISSDDAQPVDVVQPMIFAVQVALAALWRASGVTPDAVIGHSVGEIAAAVTAGLLTLEQGARLVCRRSLLLRRVDGRGAMAMVNLEPDEAARRLGDRDDVVVAVAAATTSAVISGGVEAVREVSERWEGDGLVVRRVDSGVAFHSPQMDPLLEELATAARDLPPGPARVRLYSTALADPRSDAPRDGAYWAANLRGQVRFAQAVTAAAEDGHRLFVEVSPHPVVEHSIQETLDDLGVRDAFVTHSLRRNRPERETLLTNLGLLHCHGAAVDWTALWPDGTLADLPTTAWHHRPHWVDETASRSPVHEQHDPESHNLLGGLRTVHATTPVYAWLTHLDRASRPYPGDHPVRSVEIIPAAVLLNSFLTAASATGPWPDLTDVALRTPVSVTSPRDLQIVLQDGVLRLSTRLAGHDEQSWLTHTTAKVEPVTDLAAVPPLAVRAGTDLPSGHVIERLAELGVAAMGFPWVVTGIRRGENALVVTVRAAPDSDETPPTWGAVLDAALSAASVCFSGPPVLRMPAYIRRVSLAPVSPSYARISVQAVAADTVDVEIADLSGTVVGRLSGLRYGTLDGDASSAVTDSRDLVYRLDWSPVALTAGGEAPQVTVVGPGAAGGLAGRLAEAGLRCRAVAAPEDLGEADVAAGRVVLVVPEPGTAAETAHRSSWLLARTAQRLASGGRSATARLWCLTQGVREGADVRTVGHGALWGLGRIIGGEHPDLWGGVVDVGDLSADLPALAGVFRTLREEDVVAVRGGEAAVARLRTLEGEPAGTPIVCRPDGTYLITGGLGVLGLKVAHWLADRGARRIVLAGRHAPPPRGTWDTTADPAERRLAARIRSLERLGVTVTTVALDITDPRAAAERLSPSALGLPPIRGVVHAAGVLDDRTLGALDEDSLHTVLRPKVDGGMVLHELFPPGTVDFFALFSSCGQLLGLPGQASYAAANAFLDTLAAHRRALGDAGATSIGWTSWRGLGMSTSSAVIDAELAARGTASISEAEAFGAWELAGQYGLGYAAVLRTLPLEPGEQRIPLLRELPAAGTTQDGAEEDAEAATVPWAGLEGAELHAVLTGEIAQQVSLQTRMPTDEIDPRRLLAGMGLDSVMSSRIRHGLERRFRMRFPATLFWDRPTIDAVASWLAERLTEAGPADQSPADDPATGEDPAAAEEEVAR